MEHMEEKRRLMVEALEERPPEALLREPLDYIFADHFRQRMLCNLLDAMVSEGERDLALSRHILAFLRRDFGLHVLDEELDLFPVLLERALPEDRMEDVVSELCAEHSSDKLDADELCRALDAPERQGRGWKGLFTRFAANERRHLIVENAIVIPMARIRLEPDDLTRIGRHMAERRGITFPEHAEGSAR
ncbi:hemerythrin domain-containing protein [Nitratireductor aquimarinus]|uniref:hemerythrin domain-containing protein n=1 Tax=Nitratireductor aquimarinus TaxID=889300 RepID=UPI0029359B7E|nr:hemerythrin domain-containing protein [Nitratireductor aquimarinus]MDV2965383.1 hemerythrin domain-containing protein [Nitratireductor aquimarinus]